jgi:hypothetical protein
LTVSFPVCASNSALAFTSTIVFLLSHWQTELGSLCEIVELRVIHAQQTAIALVKLLWIVFRYCGSDPLVFADGGHFVPFLLKSHPTKSMEP